MRFPTWRRLAPALSALPLLALAAPSASLAAAIHHGAGPSGVLNVGLQSDIVTMDPSLSSAYVDRQVMINIYDTLFQFSPQMKVEPDLVTHYTIGNDGKTYNLFLRHGVMFTDATPLNAQAVVFNLDRDRLPSSARASTLKPITSVTAKGQYEVVIQLSEPFSPLLTVLAGRSGMICSPKAVKAEGASYAANPVGSGPFEFVKWVRNDYIELKANPHYWQAGLPKVAEVMFHPITDPTTELNALKTGEIQIDDTVAAKDLATARADSAIHVWDQAGLGWQGIYINTKQAPFNNVDVREALQYAINRAVINRVINYNTATIAYTQFPPAQFAYDPSLVIPYDPTKAKALLAQAGLSKGFTFTMQGDNDPITNQELQLIQIMLKQVGITMNIQLLDFGTLLGNEIKENYQAMALGWSGRVDPSQNSYSFDVTGGSLNQTGFGNATIDQYMLKAQTYTSDKVRAKYYWAAAKLLDQYSPYVFLYFPATLQASSNKVQGFVGYPDGLMRLWNVSLG